MEYLLNNGFSLFPRLNDKKEGLFWKKDTPFSGELVYRGRAYSTGANSHRAGKKS